MAGYDEAFMKHLLETFKDEAREHIDTFRGLLIELEKQDDAAKKEELIELLFREAHSLKGAARSVDKGFIETICKHLESIFSMYKKESFSLSAALFKSMYESLDLLDILISSNEKEHSSKVKEILDGLDLSYKGLSQSSKDKETEDIKKSVTEKDEKSDVPPSAKKEEASLRTSQKTKVSVEKLIDIIRNMEELLFVKLALSDQAYKAHENHVKFADLGKEIAQKFGYNNKSIIKDEKVLFKEIEQSLEASVNSLKSDERNICNLIDNLLQESKNLLMFPFSSLLEGFPKIVHDISTKQEKKVDFSYDGGDIEIDKRILDEMRSPFIHLIRNAIDHGIELPQDRVKKGKSERGNINVSIDLLQNGKARINIVDDGAGIDISKIRQTALEKNLVSKEKMERMSDDEAIKLIFSSGITTNEIVTDISGRGLGLAIVEEKTSNLGGDINVQNLKEGGTRFSVTLPLLIATHRGILVKVAKHHIVIPTSSVSHVALIDTCEVKTVENKEIITLQDKIIPLHSLAELLGLETDSVQSDKGKISVAVIEYSNTQMALVVDEVISEQEVLIKDLGPQLKMVKNISNCTILSSAEVAFILNVPDIFATASDYKGRVLKETIIQNEEKTHSVKNILVVDDSITTRTLIKNILEMSGYKTITAVNGIDGSAKLMENHIDLVVSDIDMPEMNGFELTKKIRLDKQFEDLPIVLVTALESKEDKQRGLEAGANAYIVKSSFDQNNLLETIKWMI